MILNCGKKTSKSKEMYGLLLELGSLKQLTPSTEPRNGTCDCSLYADLATFLCPSVIPSDLILLTNDNIFLCS